MVWEPKQQFPSPFDLVPVTLNQSPFMADIHSCISGVLLISGTATIIENPPTESGEQKTARLCLKKMLRICLPLLLFPLPHSSVPECSGLTFPHLLTPTLTVSEKPRQVDYRFTHKAGRTALISQLTSTPFGNNSPRAFTIDARP